jgi:hypothetical protein
MLCESAQRRGQSMLRAKSVLPRQRQGNHASGSGSERREQHETDTPVDELGPVAEHEAPAETADNGPDRVSAGQLDHLGTVAFVADIADSHCEDERQQQPLQETQQHEHLEAARDSKQQGGKNQQRRGDDDQAFAPQPIGYGADERRHPGHGEERRGHRPTGVRKTDGELCGKYRQDGLGRIEIDERAETGGQHPDAATVGDHASGACECRSIAYRNTNCRDAAKFANMPAIAPAATARTG